MTLTDDREAYMLSRTLELIGQDDRFFCDYLVRTGKLALLREAYGEINCRTDELQYALAAQGVLDQLRDVLNGLLREPYCSAEPPEAGDETVREAAEELMLGIGALPSGGISLSRYLEALSFAAARITAAADRLISLYGSGKRFRLCANATADDVLCGRVETDPGAGKYIRIG